MGLSLSLSSLLDPGFRNPPSCLIQVGTERTDLGDIAPLVATVDIQLTLDEAGAGTIMIEDRRGSDGKWVAADTGLFERWKPIRVSADFGTYQELILAGYILKLTPDYPGNAGEAKLTLEVQDEGAALSREQMRRVWGEDSPMTDLEILRELVSDADLTVDSMAATGQSSRALSQEATPIQFLRERAKANGYELTISDGVVWFGPKRLDATPQPPILVYAGRETNCRNFTAADIADTPDSVRADIPPREQGATPEVVTVTPDETVLGSTPASSEGSGLGTPSVWRVGAEGDETSEERQARAQALVNEHAFKISGSGVLDGAMYGHVLKPGSPVTIDGVGPRYGGSWYVSKVAHQLSPEGYTQNFEVIRNGTGDSGSGGGPLSAAGSALAGLF
jgi:phage protein D